MIAASVAVLLVVGTGAAVLIVELGGFADRGAAQRARSGADLLATIGPDLPSLSRENLAEPLSPAELARMARAVSNGQREGLLANLQIWGRGGTIVYSASYPPGSRPSLEPEVIAALSGTSIARRHPAEKDLSAGRGVGVLDAFEPLRDLGGPYGAVEISLPLTPILTSTRQIQKRLVIILVGGALLLWLLSLPLVARAARATAEQWVPGRRRTLRAFARGLDRQEVEMAFQPQINPVSGHVYGVEALVRWRRAGELQPPAAFLPLVETSPLMARLTDRVLDLSLAELRQCDRDGHKLRMSVNCSATDLGDPSLPARVERMLAHHRVEGWRLTLEVTETAIYDDTPRALEILGAITRLGVEIALDDFGTGHASIARLQALPIDELKIDRAFMNAADGSYITAITAFGHALELRVLAEGVETPAEMAVLCAAGCDLAQGFHISRPISGRELRAWLADHPVRPPDVRRAESSRELALVPDRTPSATTS